MRLPKVYKLYDGDKYVMTGTMKEIAEKMCVSVHTVYSWHRDGFANKRVEYVGVYRAIYEVSDKNGIIVTGTREECVDAVFLAPSSISTKTHLHKIGTESGAHGGLLARLVGYEVRGK